MGIASIQTITRNVGGAATSSRSARFPNFTKAYTSKAIQTTASVALATKARVRLGS